LESVQNTRQACPNRCRRKTTARFIKPDDKKLSRFKQKVIEIQTLLADILQEPDIRKKLVASVCAIEGCQLSPSNTADRYRTDRTREKSLYPAH